MTGADEPPPRAAYRFDRFTLDLARGTLLDPGGAELPLRPKSFALLRLLVEHAGRLLDRDALMQAVWPDVFVTDDSITQCVRDIRKALGDEAGRLLRTVPKRGYLLAAEAALAVPEAAEPVPAKPRATRRLAAVLAADLVGYSRLMGQDEQGTLARLKAHREEALEPLVAGHRGRVVNRAGDSALCEFPSVVEAVACAVAIQAATAGRERDLEEGKRLRFRIGVNLGDVIAEDGDIYGDGVNVAARLEGLAEPGGVCVSGKVCEEVRGKLDDLAFADLGERALKNIARPVRAWRVARAVAAEGEGVPSQEPAAAVLPLPEHNLPQPNPLFVGRSAELEALRQALAATGRGAITQSRQAISGLGGVGKTQLALAYAYAHLGDYDLVRWLRAEEPATLAADYMGLAPALALDPAAMAERAALVAAVRGKLERAESRWLLVFDNATGPAALEAYLPRTSTGHVLVTSRWREWEGTATALELEALPETEATALLLGEGAHDETERAAAAGLAEELGRLPLALAQARAFMRARQTDIAGYREQLAAARPKVLAWRPPDAGYPLAVAQAWQASLDQAARDCPAAAELLRLLAFLAPEAVPRDLLGAAPEALPEALRDPFDRDSAVEALGRYSLARVERESLTVHRLVQAVTREGLDEPTSRGCAMMAVELVDKALPRSSSLDLAYWPGIERLLPHALVAAEAAERLGVETVAAGTILSNLGAYQFGQGALFEAEPLLRRAVAVRERVLGPEHPDLAFPLDHLANVCRQAGRSAEAEPLYQRTLAVRERALGPEHPYFAQSLGCLGLFYWWNGRRAEAEPLIERALAVYKRALGPDFPDFAYLLAHMAWLYEETDRPAEAEPLYQRALAVREQALGPEHPGLLSSLNNLAWFYQNTGRFAEAEPPLRRALAIRERALGPEHPSVASSLNALGQVCQNTGHFTEAEPLLHRALEIHERAHAPEPGPFVRTLHDLAKIYVGTGRITEAEPLLQRALAIAKRSLGPENQWVAHLIRALGKLYRDNGRPAEAEALFKRTLDIDKACALLDAVGFGVAPQDTTVELHGECWAVTLPGGRMAWFPMTAGSRQRHANQRRLLQLLAERCSFRMDCILYEAEAGWDVRSVFDGTFDTRGLYERIRTDRELALRLGRALGGVLAEQHARVRREDVAGWLPEALKWPPPSGWMRARLPAVADDPGLLAAIEQVLRRYEDQEAAAGDRVLLHANLGFHNLAYEPTNIAVDRATGDPVGVSGYAEAAWADRHHDFRYLVFDYPDDEAVLDSALEVYEPATGVRIDRERVRLCNAACAIGFLALRRGVPPEADSCGRTLAEDLHWVRHALSAITLNQT